MQLLAGRPLDLPFAIASSAPTIGVQEQILHDCEHTLRHLGHNDEEIRQALELTRALHRAAADGAPFEPTVSQLVESASHRSWYRNFPTVDDADDCQFRLW